MNTEQFDAEIEKTNRSLEYMENFDSFAITHKDKSGEVWHIATCTDEEVKELLANRIEKLEVAKKNV